MKDRRRDSGPGRGEHARFPSHYRPRTRQGRIGVVLFLFLLALTQPPFVFVWGNRITPWVLGMPFLYAYLLVIYVALIGVLFWVQRRGL